jgi:hypothetical protein
LFDVISTDLQFETDANQKFMKPLRKTFLLLLLAGILSCQRSKNVEEVPSGNNRTIKVAHWLLGQWGNTSSEGILFESWVQHHDSLMQGRSYFIRGRDTISSEVIHLVQRGDSIYYIPEVKNQNEGEVVKFQLTYSDTKTLVFENSAHDFPQMITYKLVSDDSLVAEISGLMKGERRSEKFPMLKIK